MNENYREMQNSTQQAQENYTTYAPNGYQGPVVVSNAIPAKSGGLAVGSLVCGVISIIGFWSVVPSMIMGFVGIILGSLNLARQNPQKGMAIGGIVASVLGVLLSIAILIFFASVSEYL